MNDVCFILEKKNLYVDEYLVDFEIPIFFICKDDENYKYAVECIDSHELIYVIAQVKINDILDMLKNKVSLCDFIKNGSKFWKVKSGDVVENDIIESISDLDSNMLPKQNTFLDLKNKKIENYIKKLELELISFENEFGIANLSLRKITSFSFKVDLINDGHLYQNRRKGKRIPLLLVGGIF